MHGSTQRTKLRLVKKLRIDVWSDIACPWCYVGKRHLEAALAQFAAPRRRSRSYGARSSSIRRRRASASARGSYAERLAKKYGIPERARARQNRPHDRHRRGRRARASTSIASGRATRSTRTGCFISRTSAAVQDAVKERFLRGYMTEGEAIGDPEALAASRRPTPDSIATRSERRSRPTPTRTRCAKTRPRRTSSASRAFRSS